jgi:hypothetical protein
MLHNQDSDTELQVKSCLISRIWTGYLNNALKYINLRFLCGRRLPYTVIKAYLAFDLLCLKITF